MEGLFKAPEGPHWRPLEEEREAGGKTKELVSRRSCFCAVTQLRPHLSVDNHVGGVFLRVRRGGHAGLLSGSLGHFLPTSVLPEEETNVETASIHRRQAGEDTHARKFTRRKTHRK